jgi:signal transduction histidine kinase
MGLNLADTTVRLLYLYLAQCILGGILFFMFRHFGILYRRRFLYTWALSWGAFAVYMACTGVVAFYLAQSQSPVRLVTSVVGQMSCFLQVLWVLRGTYELITERAFNRRQFKVILLAVFCIAVASVILFSQNVQSANLRHLARVGSRTLAMGSGFLFTGIVVLRNRKFSRGLGQRMLAASFIIFSVYQLYYFAEVVVNLADQRMEVPGFFGVADLLLIALMGMSMVIWLLEDEREKLGRSNKELDMFLYNTSHDLRAPIASILGLTYLGKLEFEEERARMFMDMIEARIKKLDMVIGDILSLSRSKKTEPRMEELRLKDLVDETITDIKFNKGASAIELDYNPNVADVFVSDYNQIKIVLNNLLANAVKYHNLDQPRPYIRIGFIRSDDQVEITVEDNGRGIPEESLPRIFEMFYRASVDTEGTGLGLYIVREALNKVKGTVDVTSELGKGSIFRIQLENA